MMNLPKPAQQIADIYALTHQELFELVKFMALNTTRFCQSLQGDRHADFPNEKDITDSLDFAVSLIPEAVEEAKKGWKPVV